MSQLTDYLCRQTVEAVKYAGERLTARSGWGTVRQKGETDFVTEADTSIQEQLRIVLEQMTPWAQFMGEEQERGGFDPRRPCWILDPVDGTTNLIHRLRHSAVSLALAEGGQITFGVVYNPYRNECYTARRGEGAFCNGEPLRVSPAKRLKDSLVAVGTVPGYRHLADQAFANMRRLYDCCRDVRMMGCASLALCDVAAGRLEGYTEELLQPWDYAAGLLIVEEAGGRVSNLQGGKPSLSEGDSLLASNHLLHEQMKSKLV